MALETKRTERKSKKPATPARKSRRAAASPATSTVKAWQHGNASSAAFRKAMDQIAKLEQQAARLREQERNGVISRILDAIQFYEIQPDELFSPKKQKRAVFPAPKKTKQRPGVARYGDGNGNTWTGRGRKPGWFVTAIAAGATRESLELAPAK